MIMTREEAKKLLPIIQAFAEGKVIECRTKQSAIKGIDTPNKWTEIEEIVFWNNTEYRIKPEYTYRPFKDADECWKEMLKHKPFGWTRDTHNIRDNIKRVTNSGIVYEEDIVCFEEAFNKVKFDDNTPFGVKVEE